MRFIGTTIGAIIVSATMAIMVVWALAALSLPILGAVALLRYVSQ